MNDPKPSLDQAILETQARLCELGMLVAGVAHELSNPLGFVKSNTEFMQSMVSELLTNETTPERVRAGLVEMASILAENADGLRRMAQITSELKRVARAGSVAAVCNLEEVLDRALVLAHNTLKYKAEVIREYGHPKDVMADEGKLCQVFVNILVNAAHAIEDRGEVRIKTMEEEGFSVAVIEDNGRGIEQGHMDRLFQPFFTTKPPGKGTGLGLWISKRIVEEAKGTITVDSYPGKGTRFTIRLPVYEQ